MPLYTLTHFIVLKGVSMDGDARRRLGYCMMILFYLSPLPGWGQIFFEKMIIGQAIDGTVCFALFMIVNLRAAYSYNTVQLLQPDSLVYPCFAF